MAEQSSPSRVAGKGFRTFTHNGNTYLLSQPLRMASYADEEALVLWKRRDPGDFGVRMIRTLPAAYHAAIWEGCARAAMSGIPSDEEWSAWNASHWKRAYMLWNTLDPKHKLEKETNEPIDIVDGVQWALGIITSLEQNELLGLLTKIAYVSQDTAIKNSSGRTAPAEPAPDQPTETPSSTDTPQSTDASPDPNMEV